MRVTGLQAFIIRFALRFRGIIVALFCLLVAYGSYSLGQASYDAFPEFAPPQVDGRRADRSAGPVGGAG